MFSCEFCEIFKDTLQKTPPVAGSVIHSRTIKYIVHYSGAFRADLETYLPAQKIPNRFLLVQSQQWKHYNNVSNLFKVLYR